jgi:hypothetical protein
MLVKVMVSDPKTVTVDKGCMPCEAILLVIIRSEYNDVN